MRCVLLDLNSRQVFSTEHGWNDLHASVMSYHEWSVTIYHYSGGIRWPVEGTALDDEVNRWKDRLLVLTALPGEPEILT